MNAALVRRKMIGVASPAREIRDHNRKIKTHADSSVKELKQQARVASTVAMPNKTASGREETDNATAVKRRAKISERKTGTPSRTARPSNRIAVRTGRRTQTELPDRVMPTATMAVTSSKVSNETISDSNRVNSATTSRSSRVNNATTSGSSRVSSATTSGSRARIRPVGK